MTEYRKELVSPRGRTVISHSAVETNNLVYGQGYREAEPSGKKSGAGTKSDSKTKAADKAEEGS